MFAESDLAFVINDLFVGGIGIIRLIEIIGIILIELIEKFTHDVLRLSLIDLLTTLFAILWQRHLALAWLHTTDGEHESTNRLLILLHKLKRNKR